MLALYVEIEVGGGGLTRFPQGQQRISGDRKMLLSLVRFAIIADNKLY